MCTEEIKWVEFGGDQASCDSLYSNPAYNDSFRFKTENGSIFTGNITWEQGRFNNYRFFVGEDGSDHFYYPEKVTHIESK